MMRIARALAGAALWALVSCSGARTPGGPSPAEHRCRIDEGTAFERAARGFLSGDSELCKSNQHSAKGAVAPRLLEQAYEAKSGRSDVFQGSCPAPDAESGVTEIALERGACYGNCPIDSLRLRSDGTVEYVGVAGVYRVGRHRGTIPENWFRGLAELALDIGYFGLENSYSCMVTDMPTVYSSVTRRGQRKIIRHYAPDIAGPPRLRAFEDAIDTTLDFVTWDEKKL